MGVYEDVMAKGGSTGMISAAPGGDLLVFQRCFLLDPEQSLGITRSTVRQAHGSGQASGEAQQGSILAF